MFKAAQLIEMDEFGAAFTSFTAIDLETTDNDIDKAEIVEIAAVRVRDGEIVEQFSSLVKPRGADRAGRVGDARPVRRRRRRRAVVRGDLADASATSAATT